MFVCPLEKPKHISVDEAKHNCQNSAGIAFLVANF